MYEERGIDQYDMQCSDCYINGRVVLINIDKFLNATGLHEWLSLDFR